MSTKPTGRSLVLAFVALVVLAALSWVTSALGTGTGLALAIAAAKALVIALVFMELAHAHSVDRIVAVVAVLFVVLLCVGALADVAFR
jgi:caa(3)-type oxidase subunit IV